MELPSGRATPGKSVCVWSQQKRALLTRGAPRSYAERPRHSFSEPMHSPQTTGFRFSVAVAAHLPSCKNGCGQGPSPPDQMAAEALREWEEDSDVEVYEIGDADAHFLLREVRTTSGLVADALRPRVAHASNATLTVDLPSNTLEVSGSSCQRQLVRPPAPSHHIFRRHTSCRFPHT